MFRRRDHEPFIGSYDPEHEMPDPDRDPRDRYQSDAYRHNARDTRVPYRWSPDRFEERFRDREPEPRDWDRDYRSRGYGYGYGYDYDRDRYRDFDRFRGLD